MVIESSGQEQRRVLIADQASRRQPVRSKAATNLWTARELKGVESMNGEGGREGRRVLITDRSGRDRECLALIKDRDQ